MRNFYPTDFKSSFTKPFIAAGKYFSRISNNPNRNFSKRMLLLFSILSGFIFINAVNAQTVSSSQTINVLCFGASTGAINITVTGGTENYTYDWTGPGVTAGADHQTGLAAGNYSVTVTDNGTTTGAPAYFTITEPAAALTVALTTQTNVLCFGNSTGAINITASGGTSPYTYAWTGTGVTAGAEDQTGLAAGDYSVIVTDANGCFTSSLAVTITEPATAVAVALTSKTDLLCFGSSTGAINITASGGTGTYTYAWTGAGVTAGAEEQTGLAAGNYSVIVTDANGCSTAPLPINITEPATAVSVALSSQTNVLCFGASTGAINITGSGGTSPYTYAWTGTGVTAGQEDQTGLAEGNYSVIVTDANGCSTASLPVTISQPASAVSVSLTSQINVLCFGSSTGAINITASGGTSPYTYAWTGTGVTAGEEDQTGLAAGNYSVIVTDANGCSTASLPVTISQPASAVSVALTSQINVLCFSSSTGAINITASGGTGTYTYAWTGAGVTAGAEDQTGLAAGNYSVIVTDANGCFTSSLAVTITQPATALNATISSNSPICAGTTLNLSSVVTGGTTAYTYSWTGPNSFTSGAASPSIFPVTAAAAGTYTLLVTDGNGCTITKTTTVTVNPLPTITLGNLPDFCPFYPSFNLVYTVTTDNPISYSITSGSPALPGFVPVVDAPLSGSPLTIAIPTSGYTPGTFQFIITVKNANGCTSSNQTFDVTLKDLINPTISGPADITVSTNTTSCNATGVALGTPTTSDNCSVKTVTNNGLTTYPPGITNVIWTVTDASGNTATHTQKVTVLDQINPIALCKTALGPLVLDASGRVYPSFASIDNGSSDNCSIVLKEVSVNGDFVKNYFDCSNLGVENYVGIRITDASGNQNTCSILNLSVGIAVVDNIKPVAKTKAFTLDLDASGIGILLPINIDGGSTDNCTVASREISKDNVTFSSTLSYSCSDVGPKTVWLRVKDNGYPSANTSTAVSALVTVRDITNPVAICQPSFTVDLNTLGNATILASDINNGSTDICGIKTITVSPSSFDCTKIGSNAVTLTVTDNNNNVSTCTSNVIVRDLIAPTAICKTGPIPLSLDITGNAILTTAMIDNGSNDNCGPVTLSLSKTNFTCTDKGSNTVILSVKDASGNISTCTTSVNVVDNLPPTASCTASILTLNDASGTVTLNVAAFDNGSTDNCGIVSRMLSKDNINFYSSLTFSCSEVGYKQVWLKVTDASGNSSTCSSIMTIKSNLKITLIDVNLCSLKFNSSASGGKPGYTYAWQAISGPTLNVFDAGNSTSAVFNPSLTLGIPAGNYWVRLIVTDANGCSKVDSLSFYGTVNLTGTISTACVTQTAPYNDPTYTTYTSTKPPADYTYEWIVNGTPTATVNVDYIINAGGGSTDNFIKILWKTAGQRNIVVVNDPKGTECKTYEIHVVYVKDNPLPVFETFTTPVCPQIIATYTLNSPPTSDATNWVVTNGTIMGGGTSLDKYVTVKWGNIDGYVAGTMIQTDAGGTYFCKATTVKTIVVADAIKPTITCPSNITVNANSGLCYATGVNLGTPSTYDLCGVKSVTNDAPPQFNIGTTTVTWTVKDFKDNIATCTQLVTVVDNQFPVITCPGNISQNLVVADGCTKSITTTGPTFSDNCSVTSLTWALSGKTTGNSPATGINYVDTKLFNIGVTTVTYTVTDASDKSTSCSYLVTVVDNILPTITCPAAINIPMNSAVGSDCKATGVVLTPPAYSDNCLTGLVITNNAPTVFPPGPTNVTWTVTDGSGNSKTCIQKITVVDLTPPILVCPPNQFGTVKIGECGRDLPVPYPTGDDNCVTPTTIPTLTWKLTGATGGTSGITGINAIEHYYFNLGTTLVSYLLTDKAGNSTPCSFTVTITDNQPPILGPCPTPASSYPNDAGYAYATLSFGAPTATDNCPASVPVVTWAAPGATPATGNGNISGVQFPVGSTIVTYTATDAANNKTTCSFTVIVVGSPVITCLSDIVSCAASLDPGFPTLVSGTTPISFGWQLSGASSGSGSGAIGIRSFNVGVTTITWTAANTAGSTTCTQKITVNSTGQWLGITTDGDWNNPINWCGGIPGPSTDVVITSGTPHPPTLLPGATGSVKTISVTGTTLTILNNTLQIKGSITSNNAIDATNGTIELNGSSAQTISGDYFASNTIKNLTVSNNASTTGGSLKIIGELGFGGTDKIFTANTGNVTLLSSFAATANVAQLKNGNDIMGNNFTVERFINTGDPSVTPGTHGKTWQLLATPTNGQSIFNTWQEGGAVTSGYGTELTSNVPATTTNGYDAQTPGSSLKTYNSATDQYTPVPITKAPFANVMGYYVYIRGDRTVTATNLHPSNTTVLRSTGALNKGTQEPVIIPSGRYGTVGNPYAAPIDLRVLHANSVNITNDVYLWDPYFGGVYGAGGFVTLAWVPKDVENNIPGFYRLASSANPSGTYPGEKVDTLQSGQAFFMKSNGVGDALITFTEDAKVDGNDGGRLVNGITGVERPVATLAVNLKGAPVGGGAPIFLDGALAFFGEQYSNQLDWQDGAKISNASNNVGFLRSGKFLAVERRQSPTATDTLNLYLTNSKAQAYTWNFSGESIDAPGLTAYLWDKYLNTTTPISLTSPEDVDFTITNVAASAAADRFKIVFGIAKPLPVTITTVKATRNTDKTITVNWKVENEINIVNYSIERSADGITFSNIGTTPPANSNGNTGSYDYGDANPLSTANYYRIKALSKDGQVQYSNVVKVNPLAIPGTITVHPNPVHNKEMIMVFVNEPAGTYELELTNKIGQNVYKGKVTINTVNEKKKVSLAYVTAAGVYHLNIKGPDGVMHTLELVVEL